MTAFHSRSVKGASLLELLAVLAILGALASMALPHYARRKEQAQAAVCQVNRRHIEMDERGHFLEHDEPRLTIDDRYACPSGGVYVWLIGDPDQQGYPMVGCSLHYAAQQPSTWTEPLFSSELEDMDDLIPLLGKWKTRKGALETLGRGEHRLAFGDEAWSAYRLDTTAMLKKGPGYGIYYRSDQDPNITGYAFQYDPGYGRGAFLVRKVYNGREQSPFRRVPIPEGFPVYNTAHDVSIELDGDHHRIRVDGQTILDFRDDAFETGSAGLRSWGRTQASFERITVRRPAGSS